MQRVRGRGREAVPLLGVIAKGGASEVVRTQAMADWNSRRKTKGIDSQLGIARVWG